MNEHDCKDHEQYSHKHDGYFCPVCDIWLESQCNDPECDYCVGRPEHPSEETK